MSRSENQPLNALLNVIPQPTLEQEVRRLIAVHGAEAVKAEITAATKPRRGRKPEKDWLLLRPYIEADARDWLEGRDPFVLRSQKSIAREVAAKHKGQSFDSTMRRIERKLAEKRERMMLYTAEAMSRREYPYPAHFKVLEELAKSGEMDGLWQRWLEQDRAIVARYREVYGEPDPAMTWEELEAKPRYLNALAAMSPKAGPLGGMFGAASRSKG